MKICVINNLFPPYNRGGTEVVVENQVKELSKNNDVFVITSEPLFNKININKKNYKIYRFYPWNVFSVFNINKFSGILRLIWHGIDMFNIYSYIRIRKILNKEKPDVVYGHNLTGLGYLVPRLVKKMRIKYIQTMHDVALVYPSGLLIIGEEDNYLNNFWLTRLWGKINRYLFDNLDEVRFPSEWLKEFYLERGFFKGNKCKVVRNFKVKIEKLIKNKQNINLLYIGQIEEHKGILFLVRVMNKLRYRLRIIGNGSKLEEAKKLAENNIEFLGWQDSNKVREFLKQADYVIVPSLCYENSPTVIFESLKAGVPVIASDLGGIPEFVKDGVNGYLFEAGDRDDLIKVLKSVIMRNVDK